MEYKKGGAFGIHCTEGMKKGVYANKELCSIPSSLIHTPAAKRHKGLLVSPNTVGFSWLAKYDQIIKLASAFILQKQYKGFIFIILQFVISQYVLSI